MTPTRRAHEDAVAAYFIAWLENEIQRSQLSIKAIQIAAAMDGRTLWSLRHGRTQPTLRSLIMLTHALPQADFADMLRKAPKWPPRKSHLPLLRG